MKRQVRVRYGHSRLQSELIAISGALDHALNSYKYSIWILTDSRSSILQYFKNWPKIMDSTGLDILSKLARLGQRKQVCLQWIPSHVGVPGNEAADELAGSLIHCIKPLGNSFPPKNSNELDLTAHHWYAVKSLYSAGVPGLIRRPWRALEVRSKTLVQGVKYFFIFGTVGARPGVTMDTMMRKGTWCRLSCSKRIGNHNEKSKWLASFPSLT
ncbi:RNase H domain-containing protein [Trichonephila clavipes]|nr:RNase H domain-containing protein [Trichonephila clavipes]